MSQIGLIPFYRAVDTNGNPIPNARLYTFLTGTLTPQATFTAEDLTTPHGPFVQADGNGLFPAFFPDPTIIYRYQLRVDPYTNAISGYDADPVAAPSSGGISFLQDGLGAVMRTVQDKLRETWISVKDFGAAGDGDAIDTVAINLATASLTAGETLYFPPGTYLIDNSDLQNSGASSLTPLPVGVNLVMDGGAWLKRAPDEDNGVNFITPLGNNTIQVNIDGDEFPSAGGMGGTWATSQSIGIYANGASNVRVINSNFKNMGNFGIRAEAASAWQVRGCRFYRHRQSGALFVATSVGPTEDLIVEGNSFEDMGDTACACISLSVDGLFLEGFRINGVQMIGNVARNTQYLAQGFAFDVEGGYDFGKQYGNKINENIVFNDVGVLNGQGGVTMGMFNEDGEISNNVLVSGSFENGDYGVSIQGTRRISVTGNVIVGFRGGAVYAEGSVTPAVTTASASIRQNKIYNCGDNAALIRAAILLGFDAPCVDAVVEGNHFEWDSGYTHGGTTFCGIFTNWNASNVTIRGNTFKNPPGKAISARGFASGTDQIDGAVIEDNVIRGAATSNPILCQYVIGLSLQNNRIYETAYGIDLTGSSKAEIKGNTIQNVTASSTLASWLDLTNTNLAEVENNKFDTAVTTKMVTAGATNLSFRNNRGYKTENWGESAAIATGATIAHGCDITPTRVLLTAKGGAAVKAAYTVDATNITVTHDSGGNTAFSWDVRGAA